MSGYGPRRDLNAASGEASEFPNLCEVCLGPNPYLRMSKQDLGAECKICTRPFTVFRWLPGAGMRYKKTEICQTCSKTKNVCQTCLLDLQFGLPTQVRDTALGQKTTAPTSAINREYYAQNKEAKGEELDSGAINFGKADSAGKELLKKLARNDPYYKRNRPHLCSFYAKGACNRGDECPYRHELPVENELSHQNIKDRYHGVNDPVARKILAANAVSSGLAPPADTSITSLFMTGLPLTAKEEHIRSFYLAAPTIQPSHLKSIVIVPSSTKAVAFVNFVDRKAAELGAERSSVKVEIEGTEVKVQWGRSRPKKGGASAPATGPLSQIAERELASSGK
ncbi:pre-mRNA-splicing factor RBM22/SLT11 [Pseudohyphozyma bogoriensis]|nr:pre-mRNA-splicing factor RBM22/SLT11 [Pseudohyphozyma bogoriensis]